MHRFITGISKQTGLNATITVNRPLLKTQPWAYITLGEYVVYMVSSG